MRLSMSDRAKETREKIAAMSEAPCGGVTFKHNYHNQKKDPRWEEKSNKIKARDNWTCQCCGRVYPSDLQVHHIGYDKTKAMWEYDDEWLISYCGVCHDKAPGYQIRLIQAFLNSNFRDGPTEDFIAEVGKLQNKNQVLHTFVALLRSPGKLKKLQQWYDELNSQ